MHPRHSCSCRCVRRRSSGLGLRHGTVGRRRTLESSRLLWVSAVATKTKTHQSTTKRGFSTFYKFLRVSCQDWKRTATLKKWRKSKRCWRKRSSCTRWTRLEVSRLSEEFSNQFAKMRMTFSSKFLSSQEIIYIYQPDRPFYIFLLELGSKHAPLLTHWTTVTQR